MHEVGGWVDEEKQKVLILHGSYSDQKAGRVSAQQTREAQV